ncbi:pre-mRNA-processing factor 17-like [Xenia sp. Carnegie-2017]|uniref:pre-mRNA-processing factor 17-like n=1 Tax=Xenia sp. Carnegie-2017 TaxID=2897299 RepID=UPI001F041A2D|nr:pre-mRNA-processing factor 17-like [Xenia sp. Carnegie-2017]
MVSVLRSLDLAASPKSLVSYQSDSSDEERSNNDKSKEGEKSIESTVNMDALKPKFLLNSAPIVDAKEGINWRRHIDPLMKEVTFNAKYDELFSASIGLQNPFKTKQQRAHKNMLSGYVEPSHISKFQFDNQLKTFSSYGYALDPSDDTAHIEEKFVGEVEKAKDSKGLTVFKATKQQAGDKRKREDRGDPGVIDGYKGPWSKFVDEETIAKPYEEESAILEEYELSKKNKSKKDDMKPSEEKSTLHIKDAYDYQGRSYLHIPQDLGINLKSDTPPERCFLPKQHIHTWSGHTKGVSAIRFFPKSAHLLLSCSMDFKIKKLQDDIHVSAIGSVFAKSNIRGGILPRMLEEILYSRIMVKKAMKDCKDDKTLLQLLDARRLALKLIPNVTYGYTSANFSGRMPCVEVWSH